MPLYMRIPTLPELVEAEQVGSGAHSYPQGTRPARPGDWIVTNHADGSVQVLTAEEFGSRYQLAPVPAAALPAGPQLPPGHMTATYEDGSTLTGPEPLPSSNWRGARRTDQSTPGDWTPQAEPPTSQPPDVGTGDQETFSPSGPSTPMNEGLPGRPAPTTDVEPRLPYPGPITTPTGQVAPKEEVQPSGSAVHTEPTNPDLEPNEATPSSSISEPE